MKRLMKKKPGLEVWYHGDGEKFHIEHKYDGEEIANYAKDLSAAWQPRKGEVYRMAATIPLGLIQQWRNEYGIDPLHPDNWNFLKKRLNDNEFRDLRVWTGNL